MATNVTQKDITLHSLLAHLQMLADRYDLAQHDAALHGSRDAAMFLAGQITALTDTITWAREHLGYTGSMPLEVLNQSEEEDSSVADS